MSAFAGFTRGLAGGIALGKDIDPKDGLGPVPGTLSGAAAAAEPAADSPVGVADAANGYVTQDPVASGMAPYQKAFLNAVAAGESSGDYNVRYGGPNGAQQFEGFDKHPNILEDGPHGKSSAAGRYQFTGSTWKDMGGGAFTPEMQDQRAWALADQRYRASTGRDLGADLQARGLGADQLSALRTTWTSFDNQGRAISAYNDSMARYAGGGGAAAAADAPRGADFAPAEPAPKSIIEAMGRNAKRNIETAKSRIEAIGSPAENWQALREIIGG